jgi:dUTP pyrophosphatase
MKPRLAVPVKFKQIHPNAVIPEYKTHGAACVDLVITEIEYIDEDRVIVKYGFAAEIPDGYKVTIQPRSSFTSEDWVMQNSPGIIDSDYRGEWITKFRAFPIRLIVWGGEIKGLEYPPFPWKVGDRIVQASIDVNIHMKFKKVEELSTTIRGEGSFGHTGK